MWTYTELAYTLSALYYSKEDIVSMVIQVDLRPEFIPWSNTPINNWTNVIKHAETRDRQIILNIIELALQSYPENKVLLAYKENVNVAPSVNSGYTGKASDWKGPRYAPGQLEKLMAKESTLLPIHFLERGLETAKAVARVETKTGYGSGFLINNNFFVTNNHVISSEDAASKSRLQFNYQQTPQGRTTNVEVFFLDPANGFATSDQDENDWTIVKVKGNPNQNYGALELKSVTLKKDDYVNIIQHPAGEYKQIALYHNTVAFVNESRVQYLTDTLPGSSGSPVFNSDWELVALHHSGGWILEPGTSIEVYRNEGININVLVEAIARLGLV